MAAYDQHHFVPRFLLEAWRSGPDGLLSTFHWDYHKNLRHGRHSPKGVAKLFQLYSLKSVPDANWIERDFLGPQVDDPGATAYHAIMNLGVDKLSPEQVDAWTRFLVSLMVRGPDMVALARARGADVLRQSLAERPDEYLAARGNDPAKTLLEFVENNRPEIFHDIAPRILPDLVMSPNLTNAIRDAIWMTQDFTQSTVDLCIGDRPLIYLGTMASSFLLALPLSPRKVFFAFNEQRTGQNLAGRPVSALARQLNLHTVSQAMRYVYAAHGGHHEFIRRNLAQP
jgi:hypothetical protein